jgi:ParB family chromosome partitioning protein
MMARHETITATEARFPLAKLTLSPMNPRQAVPVAEVEDLAQSIWTAGLIQSIAGLADAQGNAEIVAGGRRLRALQLLAAQHPDLAILRPELANPLVMLAPDAETARAWAGAENVARRDLHPADEIRAYGRMAGAGAQPSAIARAFAVTEKHVYRRLALANLPGPVLEALAANDISLSMAAAFTICNDESHALEVLERCRSRSWSDHLLKTALRPESVKASDRRAVFVGLEAYQNAGGTLAGDLFADETYLDDTALLDRLFDERLDAAVAGAATGGWHWAEARGDLANFGWYQQDQARMAQLRPIPGACSAAEAERYDALAELAEEDALDEAGQAEFDRLQCLCEGSFSDGQKAVSGVIVYVDHAGCLCRAEGLVKPEHKSAARAAGFLAGGDPAAEEAKPKSPISKALADDLARAVTGARQHAALRKPDLLLALLAYQLTGKMGHRHAFGLRAEAVANLPSTGAEGYALDARLTLPGTPPADPWGSDLAKGFRAFRKKGSAHVMAELTRHLAAVLTGGDAALRQLIDTDVKASTRDVWTPTVANFWTRVPGAYRQQVWRALLDLKEDHPTATTFAKMKKAEQADRLEKLFTDPAFREAKGLTGAQVARIAQWLPEGMA